MDIGKVLVLCKVGTYRSHPSVNFSIPFENVKRHLLFKLQKDKVNINLLPSSAE